MAHIKKSFDTVSWCGEPLGTDFYFKDMDQVLVNGEFSTRPVCQNCLIIVNNLIIKNKILGDSDNEEN